MPPYGAMTEKTILGWAMAARKLGTLLAISQGDLSSLTDEFNPWLIPVLEPELPDPGIIPKGVRIVELPWVENLEEPIEKIKEIGDCCKNCNVSAAITIIR